MALAHVILTTVQSSGSLPSIIGLPFSVVHNTHKFWRQWRRASLYTNPNSLMALGAGQAMMFGGMIAKNPFLRAAAQTALICSRVFECIEQHNKVLTHCRLLIHSAKGEYLPHRIEVWPSRPNNLLLSPSTIIWWRTFSYDASTRFKQMSYHTYHIITGIFQLSMLILDTAESFSLSQETGQEAVRELFISINKDVDGLIKNSTRLLELMHTHRDMIQKLLTGMGIPISFDQLLVSLNKVLGNVDQFNQAAKKAQSATSGLMIDLMKKGLFGLLISLGLSELIPNAAVTKLTPLWGSKPSETPKRYPPKEWITRPSMLRKESPEKEPSLSPDRAIKIPKMEVPDYLPISEMTQKVLHIEQNTKTGALSLQRKVAWFNNPEAVEQN